MPDWMKSGGWSVRKTRLNLRDDMADFDSRLSSARQMAAPFIWLRCLDIEEKLKLGTSYASLSQLTKICPKASLIWIMGADNLAQFPHWYRAGDIARLLPVLVMNRPGYGWPALASKGAAMLGRHNRCQPASLARRDKKTGKGRRKNNGVFIIRPEIRFPRPSCAVAVRG